MNRLIKYSILLILFCSTATVVAGQDYEKKRAEIRQKLQETRAEKQNLESQIEQYQEQAELAEQKYERLYKQFEDLKKVIALQEEKIKKLKEEQNHIKEEISVIADEIETNEEQLERLIENYKKTLTYIYKHGRESQLALIFSSQSMNQMLVRSYYLKKFEEYRQNQADQIQEKQTQLKQNRAQLEQSQANNENVLAEIQTENAKLENKRVLQEKNVALLRENKEQREAQLEQKIRDRERLENLLNSLNLEFQRVRDAENSGTPINALDGGYISEDRLKEIENSFQSQKGTLSWPVESTTVSEHFGRKRHPVYGTITESLGIEIVTGKKDSVRVVHPGKVIEVKPFAGYGDVVMVQHGRFITAYGNLSQVLVRKNDILEKGDLIGKSGDKNSVKGTSLFFLLRENNTNLDPEEWLSSR